VPETQPAATVLQVCPCLLLHIPLASQVPAHRPFGSLAFLTATHAWVVVSQLVQAAVQSVSLQQAVAAMQIVVPAIVQDFMVPVHE
jgi:hypothetical protein